MSKIIKTLFLLIIICGTVLFSVAEIQARTDNRNYFNTNLRRPFDRSQILRNIFSLHSYGDARADYLGSKYKNILIEAQLPEDQTADPNLLTAVGNKISEITGKNTTYLIDPALNMDSGISSAEIGVARNFYKYGNTADTAVIHLTLLGVETDQPNVIGDTLMENGMVIFIGSIQAISSGSTGVAYAYELGTILHEFGHQLGLEHNDLPDCLMNPRAEVGGQPAAFPGQIATDFCPAEIQQINNMAY